MGGPPSRPPSERELLREWRELGTTGSTDGSYADPGTTDWKYARRKHVDDIGWLVKHWGVDAAALNAFLGGAVEMGTLGPRHLEQVVAHAATEARRVLDSAPWVRKALSSSCATSSETFRLEKRTRMVQALQQHGVSAAPADKLKVSALLAEAAAAAAARAKPKPEAKPEGQLWHPGKLETKEADLSGLDSTELRHVERFYEQWSCCRRGKGSVGCTRKPP